MTDDHSVAPPSGAVETTSGDLELEQAMVKVSKST